MWIPVGYGEGAHGPAPVVTRVIRRARNANGSRFSCVFVSRVCVLCAALLPRAPQPRARAPVCMGYPTRKKSIHMRHDDTGLISHGALMPVATCVIFLANLFLQVQKPELCVPAPTRFQRLRFQHCKASPKRAGVTDREGGAQSIIFLIALS